MCDGTKYPPGGMLSSFASGLAGDSPVTSAWANFGVLPPSISHPSKRPATSHDRLEVQLLCCAKAVTRQQTVGHLHGETEYLVSAAGCATPSNKEVTNPRETLLEESKMHFYLAY